MINREWQKVKVLTYNGGKDEYGQTRNDIPTEREVEMVIKNYNRQIITNNVIYDDITDIGLTYDKEITDANQIKAGSVVYDILYVLPSRRCQQILMRKE